MEFADLKDAVRLCGWDSRDEPGYDHDLDYTVDFFRTREGRYFAVYDAEEDEYGRIVDGDYHIAELGLPDDFDLLRELISDDDLLHEAPELYCLEHFGEWSPADVDFSGCAFNLSGCDLIGSGQCAFIEFSASDGVNSVKFMTNGSGNGTFFYEPDGSIRQGLGTLQFSMPKDASLAKLKLFAMLCDKREEA